MALRPDKAGADVLVPQYAEASQACCHAVYAFAVTCGDQHPLASDEFYGILDFRRVYFLKSVHSRSPFRFYYTLHYIKYAAASQQ